MMLGEQLYRTDKVVAKAVSTDERRFTISAKVLS